MAGSCAGADSSKASIVWSFFEIERAWGPLRLTTIGTVLDGLTVRRIRNFDGNTDAAVMTDLALDWMQQNAGRGEPFLRIFIISTPIGPIVRPTKMGKSWSTTSVI